MGPCLLACRYPVLLPEVGHHCHLTFQPFQSFPQNVEAAQLPSRAWATACLPGRLPVGDSSGVQVQMFNLLVPSSLLPH